jgi:hypothetical protein
VTRYECPGQTGAGSELEGIPVKLTRLGGLGVAASLAVAAGLAPAVAQASVAGHSPAPVVTHYTGTPGVAKLLPRTRPSPSASALPARIRPRGARRLPSRHFSAQASAPAMAAPAAVTTTAAPLVNFNGVSSRDSQFTNYELTFEPPDQGLCEGNGFVLEAVNSAYRIYKKSGTSLRGPFNVNDLFNVGGQEFTSDPRCWYDSTTQTWFATVLFISGGGFGNQGALLIAVRHSPDPRGLWNEYSIDTTDSGAPPADGCPCFGDQPRIGVDGTNLYVTDDEFSILGPEFNGPEVWAFDKAQLVAGDPTVNFARFAHLNAPLAPQPALTDANPSAEFFLGSLDPNGTGDHRIQVWAMTNEKQVGLGGTPTLTSVVIPSEAYAVPPPAPQEGATSTLDSGDDRMQQAQYAGGTVWGELTTAIQPAGDTKARAGGAWFQVRPQLGYGGISGASIVRQGYLAARGQYELYPAVQPDAAGNAAVIFTLTSSSRYPSAAYATLSASGSHFGPAVVAAAGRGHYDKTATRWGDYSFAVPDSSAHSAWLATEYIPPKSSQTTTGLANWGTRVLEVPLP